MTRRSIILAGVLAALACFAVGQAARADALDDIRQAKTIRIATDLGLPPYSMTDANMQPTGSDIETARLLARDFGVQLALVPTIAASRIPMLLTGKADLVIATLSITPDRAKVIDFSVPYATLRTVIAGIRGIKVETIADLTGKTVGVTRGTPNDLYLSETAKGVNVLRYEDDATTAEAFASGQVDLIATAELLLPPIAQKNTSRQIEIKYIIEAYKLAIGVKKGEPRLLQAVDSWVRTNLKNGKLNDIYKRFHGTDLPEVILKERR